MIWDVIVVWIVVPFAAFGIMALSFAIRRLFRWVAIRRFRRRLDKPFDRQGWRSR